MREELILEVIKERWSPYAFSSAPVEEYKLKAMFEAASHAPSCNNDQPWLFVFSTSEQNDVFSHYLGFLAEGNRIWAQNAYALIICLARTKFSFNGNHNRFSFYDTGMAVANMLVQAQSMDVYAHQMAGYSVQKVKDYFKLTDEFEPAAIIALGYLGEGLTLPPELLKRDEVRRPRKPIHEIVFKNRLSDPAFK
jgi:nitroreductase